MTVPNTTLLARIKRSALPALGAGLAIAGLGWLSHLFEVGFLIAPLGASATLIWIAPTSPLALPRAVIGGSLVSAACGLLMMSFLGSNFWGIGIGVALAIIAMVTLDMLHAPAGALPVLIGVTHPDATNFLLALLASTCLLVSLGVLFHKVVALNKEAVGVAYPSKWW